MAEGMTREAALAALTGPGAPFEVVRESVGGVTIPVFAKRPRSLRDVLADSRKFGDAPFSVWDTGVQT